MWHRQLAWIDPVDAASRLRRLGHLSFLDSALEEPTLGRYSAVAVDPFGLFEVRGGVASWNGADLPGEPIGALRAKLAECACESVAGLPPFQGGAVGFVSYEFGWALEGRAPPQASRGVDVRLTFHDVVVAFDHRARTCFVIASGLPQAGPARPSHAAERIAQVCRCLGQPAEEPAGELPEIVWAPTISAGAYAAGVEQVKAFIAAGDIYQANIAQRFVADLPPGTDPWALYRHLRRVNPAPFAAYLECGTRQLLSMSPELFLRMQDGSVETRPIKGTARRDDVPAADRAAAAALLASRKDRAENVMIVDLLRNDLSRTCRPESVEVASLCALESYAGLHHLVSVVTGELRAGVDALDLLAASFPGGSITGAPKLRAMEIIAEIERSPRGVYCGAIGAIGFDGRLDLSIAIRTLVIDGATIELRTGGGITMLSDAAQEYEETLTKARRVFEAFAAQPKRRSAEAGA